MRFLVHVLLTSSLVESGAAAVRAVAHRLIRDQRRMVHDSRSGVRRLEVRVAVGHDLALPFALRR